MVCQFRSTYGTSHSMPVSYVEGLYLVADRTLLRVLTDFPISAGSPSLTYPQFFLQIHPPMLQYIHVQVKPFFYESRASLKQYFFICRSTAS